MTGEKVRIRFYFLEVPASNTKWVEVSFTSQENFDWQWEKQMREVNANMGMIFLHTVNEGEIVGFKLSNIAYIKIPAQNSLTDPSR